MSIIISRTIQINNLVPMFLFLIFLTPGCTLDTESNVSQGASKFTIGGFVYVQDFNLDVEEPLGEVIVTVVDLLDGTTALSGATNDSGVWKVSGVTAGEYSILFEKTGYDDVEWRNIGISATAMTNRSPYISLDKVQMEEPPIQGTVSPFGVTIAGNNSYSDGFDLVEAQYSKTEGEDITVTLNYPLENPRVEIGDWDNGIFLTATANTDNTVFTLSSTDLESLIADEFDDTLVELIVSGDTITPLREVSINIYSTLNFNVVE